MFYFSEQIVLVSKMCDIHVCKYDGHFHVGYNTKHTNNTMLANGYAGEQRAQLDGWKTSPACSLV